MPANEIREEAAGEVHPGHGHLFFPDLGLAAMAGMQQPSWRQPEADANTRWKTEPTAEKQS